jgi:REP element-mobilizing transposase RayT
LVDRMASGRLDGCRVFVVNPGLPPGVSFAHCMSAHQSYQLYAHVSWHTWQRIGCVDQGAAGDLVAAINDASLRCGVRCLRLAVLSDHVHLLISYRPTTRICDFVRLCKAGSSYRAGRRVPGAIRWARGYYVASLSKQDLPRVDAYISCQPSHHPDRIPQRGQ